MGSELELLVSPFRRAKLTRDQSHAVDTAEVAIPESVACLGVVVRAVGKTKMPLTVLLPGVILQEGVFIVSTWLTLAPPASQYVVMGIDKPSGMRYRPLVD